MYEVKMNVADRDSCLNKIEQQIQLKRRLLLEKRKYLEENVKENQFLENVLQNSLSKKCNTLVKKNIYSNYKFSLQDSVYALRKEQLYIDEDSRCSKCFKSFDSCIFTRQSNGKLCHTTCKDAKIK